ncbi:hypothetical protein HOC13_04685 [Candidatus Woesearchaeota archaeon]|nr:hypothetical protein [Candidatus Woesearchaeota archaeon]
MNDCQNFVDAMVESSKKKYKQPKPKICDVDVKEVEEITLKLRDRLSGKKED